MGVGRSRTLREEFPSVIDVAYKEWKRYRPVSDIMTRNVFMIERDANMMDAARLMGEHHIGSLLVKGAEGPAGIVTERDLLTRVIAAGKEPDKVMVADVMSPRLVTIRPDATIREAARKMIKEKGRLTVMDDRGLAGIVTAADLIRSLPDAPETVVPVGRFMTKTVVGATPEDKVLAVARTMGRERIGSVIVYKGKKPWGIFTERDLLSKVIYGRGSLDDEVGKYTSRPLIGIDLGYTIHKAASMMAARHIRRLPVFDGERLIGIITARDLVEAYAL